MNKIFKVIFNTSLGRMVIVSENAKSQGKVKSTQNTKNQPIAFKIKVIKPLIVCSSLFLTQHIFAENILQRISCSSANPNIELISESGATSLLLTTYSTSIFGDNSVTINSSCDQRSFLLSNAIGIGGSASDYGVALGYGALAYRAYNVAIGSQAKAYGNNSVAIGANSVTDRANTFAVGSATNLRQITSVAAGTDNTDAVNKLQMDDSVGVVNKRVTTEVGTLDGKIKLNKDAITTLDTRVSNEVSTLDGKIGTNTGAITALDGRVTINESDISNLQQGIGSLAGAVVTYDDPMSKDQITLAGSSGTRLSNLKAGDISSVSSTDAVTGGQLFTTNQNVSALDTRVSNQVSTLDGKISTNTGAITALDGRVTINESDISNLQQGIGSLAGAVVTYDDPMSKDKITLAGSSGTTLSNLKAGDISSVNSTDAVTGGQLFTTNQNVSALDTRVSNQVSTLDGKIGINTGAITALDGRVGVNEFDISNLQQGIGSLAGAVVTYDDPMSKDKITLAGSSGTTLSNLKAGDISSVSSTDAVTGGQLFTTNQNITTLATQVGGYANQTASILGGGAGFNNGVFTLPNYSIQGKNYSNVGDTFGAVNNELSSIKGSVVDLKNYVNQQNQIVLDQSKDYTNQSGQALNSASKNYVDQSVASSNQQAKQYTDQSIASSNQQTQQYTDQKVAGLHAQIKEDGKFINVTGSSTELSGNNSGSAASVIGGNSLALGVNASVQGTNSTAIGYGAQVIGDSSISIGDQNQVTGNGSGALGDPNIVVGNNSYIIGNDNTVKADHTFVLGNNVQTTAKNAVALGNNTELTRDNTVSVGSTNSERQITHVADATEQTDAVNLRQMQTANKDTLETANNYTDLRYNRLESSFSDFSYRTERRFQEIDKQFDRQGAMSAAMMNMATSTSGLKGRNRVGVGAGFQGEEKAVAVGYQRMVNENTSFSLGGAFTDDERSGGAGVGFSW